MPSQESVDTDRAVVTTYVPAYQKSAWESHATDLDMSQSEFVRSMVQAGRRGFGVESDSTGPSATDDRHTADSVEDRPPDVTPGVDTRRMVLQTLEESGPLTGEEIVDVVLEEWRGVIGETLEELLQEGAIRRPALGNEFELVED